MFFPMHRVERLELDLPEGTLPSLAQRFAQKTGQDPAPILVGEFLPTAAEDAAAYTANAAKHSQDDQADLAHENTPGDPPR